MRASILAIGTELIMGQTVNTNAAEISKVLTELGIPVFLHTSVGDNKERILESLDFLYKHSDLVITTGGLGPTQDDITRDAVAAYFKRPLVEDGPSLEYIRSYFQRAGYVMNENNIKQAHFPEGSEILENPQGTAPGFLLKVDGKMAASLPGPPSEMRGMLNQTLRPILEGYTDGCFRSKYMVLYGIGESAAETEIDDMITDQTNPTIAPYAEPGKVMYRITAKADTPEEAEALLIPTLEKFKQRLGQYVISEDGSDLYAVVPQRLIETQTTLALAESCTGGMLAAGLTNYPGISAVLERGIVTYSNQSKVEELGVPESVLENHGAVSRETAEAMALGLYRKTNADICVSITGIAGPEGGTETKPVGLVYIGVSYKGSVTISENKFFGNRHRVRSSATLKALSMILNAVNASQK